MTQPIGVGRERGFSTSILVCLLIPVLLLCIGLAVDGAAKAAADRRAEALAAQAARTGMDAAAGVLLNGGDARSVAVAAASQVIAAHPEMSGNVTCDPDNALVVTISTSTPTIFLGLAGIDSLPGRGYARVVLKAR